MKKETNFVVCCYTKQKKPHWKKLFPLSTIKNFLPIWCIIPTETISIRTYSCLDDLLFSVLNYLTTTQETTMTYKDILTSGEN